MGEQNPPKITRDLFGDLPTESGELVPESPVVSPEDSDIPGLDLEGFVQRSVDDLPPKERK